MTAANGFLRPKEINKGSSNVLWLHTYNSPFVLFWTFDWRWLGFESLSLIPVEVKIGIDML